MLFFLALLLFIALLYLVIRLVAYLVNSHTRRRITDINKIDLLSGSVAASFGYLIYSIATDYDRDISILAVHDFNGFLALFASLSSGMLVGGFALLAGIGLCMLPFIPIAEKFEAFYKMPDRTVFLVYGSLFLMSAASIAILVLSTLHFSAKYGSYGGANCAYAEYDYFEAGSNKPYEGFQVLLHTVTEKRLEVIGRNYETGDFWKFSSGDYIVFNDSVRINMETSDKSDRMDFDIDWEDIRRHQKRNDFVSEELSEAQLGFLILGEITSIKLTCNSKIHYAALNIEQSAKFNNAFNCLYNKDRRRRKRLNY